MKLRDFSRRIQSEEQPDFTYALQGSLDLAELSVAKLVNFPDTIYIVNSQSVAFGKIQKETLLYLLDRQQKFQFEQILDSMNDGVIAVDNADASFMLIQPMWPFWVFHCVVFWGRFIQDVETGFHFESGVAGTGGFYP